MTSGNDSILGEAGEAPEEVVSVGAASDGPYLSPNFFFNPATGAYEPTAEFIEVGRKSLAATAKRINRDLKRRQAIFKLRLFTVRFQLFLVKCRLKAQRILLKLYFDRHENHPSFLKLDIGCCGELPA